MTRDEVLTILRRHKNELEERFGIEEIALFGSFARNEATRNSDIDLAILKMRKKSYWTLLDAISYLSERLDRKVDAGFYDAIRPFVRKRIEKEMVRV